MNQPLLPKHDHPLAYDAMCKLYRVAKQAQDSKLRASCLNWAGLLRDSLGLKNIDVLHETRR